MKTCACLLVLFTLSVAAVAEPADPTKPVIAVELKTATPVVRKGQFPRFTIEVVNRSRQEVILVRPGDGSECGWRTPLVSWLVEGVKQRGMARCGNVNSLRPNEVFTLKPGQRVSLGEWVGAPHLPAPGFYTIRFRYENKPGLKWSGVPLGRHDEGAMARVRASTPASAESNHLRIEVKDSAPGDSVARQRAASGRRSVTASCHLARGAACVSRPRGGGHGQPSTRAGQAEGQRQQ